MITIPTPEELEIRKVRRLAQREYNAQPVGGFTELWHLGIIPPADWRQMINATGTIAWANLDGRGHANMEALAVGDWAVLGSLAMYNCSPLNMAIEEDKALAQIKKLIMEISLGGGIGAPTDIIEFGLNNVNNAGAGLEAVYFYIDGVNNGVRSVSAGVQTHQALPAMGLGKHRIEILSNAIRFYEGVELLHEFTPANVVGGVLPEDTMYLWFRIEAVAFNAGLQVNPLRAWYEMVELEF